MLGVGLLLTLGRPGCHEDPTLHSQFRYHVSARTDSALDQSGALHIGQSDESAPLVEIERCGDGRIFLSVTKRIATERFERVELYLTDDTAPFEVTTAAGWCDDIGCRSGWVPPFAFRMGWVKPFGFHLHGSVTLNGPFPPTDDNESVIAYDIEGTAGDLDHGDPCRFQGKLVVAASNIPPQRGWVIYNGREHMK
jgi:hypothetical protein